MKNKMKNSKGSITLYTLISMCFFLVLVSGLYINSSYKIQKQQKELEKIQKEYEKNNINEVYDEIYNNYVNTETPTIQAWDGEILKSEVIGEKVSSKKTIYLANKHVTLKFLSKNTSDTYAYSATENGEKIKIEGNTLNTDITTTGKTIYVYIVDNEGNYSEYYTAVTMILVTLQDKTIYIEEGKKLTIGEIRGENAGDITFGQVSDSTIIKLEKDTVTGLKAGTTTLMATEEKAGAIATITVKVVKITLTPDGGTYTMPTEGTATIKTTVTTINAEKIEIAWSDNVGKWNVIENNKLVEKKDCTNGNYYLYVRIDGNLIYKSKEFIVGENALESNKIIIMPSTTNWTNKDIEATVTYGSTLTLNKKAGCGTSLSAAKTAARESTATNVTVTNNGYVFASATDAAGNTVTASLQITNIDKSKPNSPTISVKSGTEGNNGYYRSNVVVKITEGPDSQSGVKKTTYILSGSTTKSETTISSGETITISNEGTTIITAYTYDNVENKSDASTLVIKKDTIAPTIKPLYSENTTQALVRLDVKDDNGLQSLKVGNTEVDTKNNKNWIYDMYTSTDGSTTITATDIAGNTTTRTHNIKFLYTRGNLRTENTGGWSQNYHKNQFGDVVNVNYSNDNGLFILAEPTELEVGRLGSWYTTKAINLSGYEMIRSVTWLNKNTSVGTNSSGEDITGTIWLGLSGEVKASADLNTAKEQNDYDGNAGYWVRLQSDISNINDSKQCMIGTNGGKSAYIHMFLTNMYVYSFK